ncbi:MAG: hypothetical protein JNK68_05870 [Betaproteobacteria bacterium]|nr:hypothetical protein [Betaproteobacteria bacterium]
MLDAGIGDHTSHYVRIETQLSEQYFNASASDRKEVSASFMESGWFCRLSCHNQFGLNRSGGRGPEPLPEMLVAA